MQHLETSYTTHDGLQLFLQAWMPAAPRAALLLVHGLGEHSSRYLHVAQKLVEHGIAVFTFDGRGHGQSDMPTPSGFVGDYTQYLKDIDALYSKVRQYLPEKPAFLLGHSMGGGMVAAYALAYQPQTAGIILSAPALQPAADVPVFLQKLAPYISKWVPHLKVLELNSSHISRDPEVVSAYDRDPLVHHGGFPARTGHELLKMMGYIELHAGSFGYPVLLLHGSADKLTDPKGTSGFFERISAVDKTLVELPGLYHEILNEPEKETVINRICEWIIARS